MRHLSYCGLFSVGGFEYGNEVNVGLLARRHSTLLGNPCFEEARNGEPENLRLFTGLLRRRYHSCKSFNCEPKPVRPTGPVDLVIVLDDVAARR